MILKIMILKILFLSMILALGLPPATAASIPKVSPPYDIYVGFIGQAPCEPVRGYGHFNKFSFDSLFRDVRFVLHDYHDVSRGRKQTYNWYFSSLGGAAAIGKTKPILVLTGEGDIDFHELCPYWTDDFKKKKKVTPGATNTKFNPLLVTITAGDRRAKQALSLPSGPEGVPLEPLYTTVMHYVAGFERHPPLITWKHEGSDGDGSLREFKFYVQLSPVIWLGKDIEMESSFDYKSVPVLGTLRIRFIPAQK